MGQGVDVSHADRAAGASPGPSPATKKITQRGTRHERPNDRQTAEHGAAIFPYAAEAAGDRDAGYTPEWEDGRDAQAVTLASMPAASYDAAIEDDERTYLQMCAEQGREPVEP